ncbi:MAG: GTPase HflX [Firmicutes bacterium]|nr:GTPase HflX [Bacillota bacterium]
MFETEKQKERLILIGIDNDASVFDIENSLKELEELAKTAGAEAVGYMTQKKDTPDKATYFGKGKLEELKNYIEFKEADGVLCDDDLSPAQIRNLERILKVKIISRTLIILDIFAMRAASAEGKVQVELAQLKYSLTHLTGHGREMSRLGGGIGTRGPGEKKLEIDKRLISDRISELNKHLKQIEHHRTVLRQKREKNKIPVVALVGYTNAGKSTLLNKLTGSGVLAEDKLFATLDTTTREYISAGGAKYLLTDTVGFIQKLPHGLIKAFRATLEEVKYADVLIHMVDASNPNRNEHILTVYQTLKELGAADKPTITFYNKMDAPDIEMPLLPDRNALKTLMGSVKGEVGLEELVTQTEEAVKSLKRSVKVLIPYSEGKMLSLIHGNCEIVSSSNEEQGYFFELYTDTETYNRLERYILQ